MCAHAKPDQTQQTAESRRKLACVSELVSGQGTVFLHHNRLTRRGVIVEERRAQAKRTRRRESTLAAPSRATLELPYRPRSYESTTQTKTHTARHRSSWPVRARLSTRPAQLPSPTTKTSRERRRLQPTRGFLFNVLPSSTSIGRRFRSSHEQLAPHRLPSRASRGEAERVHASRHESTVSLPPTVIIILATAGRAAPSRRSEEGKQKGSSRQQPQPIPGLQPSTSTTTSRRLPIASSARNRHYDSVRVSHDLTPAAADSAFVRLAVPGTDTHTLFLSLPHSCRRPSRSFGCLCVSEPRCTILCLARE